MNKNNTILQVVRYWQTSATKSKHFRWMKKRITYSLKFINVWVCCWVNMYYTRHVIERTHNRVISHAWGIAIKYSRSGLYFHNWYYYSSFLFTGFCIWGLKEALFHWKSNSRWAIFTWDLFILYLIFKVSAVYFTYNDTVTLVALKKN